MGMIKENAPVGERLNKICKGEEELVQAYRALPVGEKHKLINAAWQLLSENGLPIKTCCTQDNSKISEPESEVV